MNALAPLLIAVLAQSDPAPAEPAQDPAPAAAPAPTAPAPGTPATPPGMKSQGMGGGGKSVSPQEVNRQLERIKALPPERAAEEAKKMAAEFGGMAGVNLPTQPPDTALIDSEGFSALSEVEQVRMMARVFSQHIISGDARSLVLLSAFPFQLEDRNLASPDELHVEWLKNLRNKRTDVLTLYGVDVLTPQEMEKKYGKPPQRLGRMPLNQPRTFISVNNLSGRAAIVVWRYFDAHWQAVAYTD